MHVYIVYHVLTNGSWGMCGVWCTEAQARRVCAKHPIEDDMKGMTYQRVPLWGFPYLWVIGGLFFLLGVALYGAL